MKSIPGAVFIKNILYMCKTVYLMYNMVEMFKYDGKNFMQTLLHSWETSLCIFRKAIRFEDHESKSWEYQDVLYSVSFGNDHVTSNDIFLRGANVSEMHPYE